MALVVAMNVICLYGFGAIAFLLLGLQCSEHQNQTKHKNEKSSHQHGNKQQCEQ